LNPGEYAKEVQLHREDFCPKQQQSSLKKDATAVSTSHPTRINHDHLRTVDDQSKKIKAKTYKSIQNP
jgi:hypothetical protein